MASYLIFFHIFFIDSRENFFSFILKFFFSYFYFLIFLSFVCDPSGNLTSTAVAVPPLLLGFPPLQGLVAGLRGIRRRLIAYLASFRALVEANTA